MIASEQEVKPLTQVSEIFFFEKEIYDSLKIAVWYGLESLTAGFLVD